MIHKEVTTEFGTYIVKYNHGYTVHTDYFCIDAYEPVPEHEYWEKCPCCGLKPKVWRFGGLTMDVLQRVGVGIIVMTFSV